MPLKLLHTADWQIGRAYSGFNAEDAAALAEARFTTVEQLARLATEQQADAVLVAGDVFDAQTLAPRTLRRLFHALAGFSGPWVLMPGNHDAALGEGVWAQVQRLNLAPPNVHLALQPGVLELPAARCAVLLAPLTQRHTHSDLTAPFDHLPSPEGWFRVGMAHGAVQGLLADSIDSANPIAADRADTARLDYLALGDWHGTRIVGPRCAYSGTPEPDRFRNNDAGQALWVELDAPGALPRLTPVATGQHDWRQWALDLQVPSDLDQALAELASLPARTVLDFSARGRLDLAQHQRLLAALGACEGRLRALRCDLGALQMAPTAEDIAALHADGWLGEVLAELRDTPAEPAEAAATAQAALALLTTLLADGPAAAGTTPATGACA
jgi:hypothetical protein